MGLLGETIGLHLHYSRRNHGDTLGETHNDHFQHSEYCSVNEGKTITLTVTQLKPD